MRIRVFILLFAICLLLPACTKKTEKEATLPEIYLLGEEHLNQQHLERELEVWSELYARGARHLFIEHSYATAAYLNEWMASPADSILYKLYDYWEGSFAHHSREFNFLKTIKRDYPETIFHGTDVEHQFSLTGRDYLRMMIKEGKKDSDEFKLAQENCNQGKTYYVKLNRNESEGASYRETCMVENFIREYEKLEGVELIMGIYGAFHTETDDTLHFSMGVPMATQLVARYGSERLHVEDLQVTFRRGADVAKLLILGREYDAVDFGKRAYDFPPYTHRQIWRLDSSSAYDEFSAYPLNGEEMEYKDFPMHIDMHQVFVIEYTKSDGTVKRKYFRSEKPDFDQNPTTQGFSIVE